MSDIFREVDEDVRNEKYSRLWKRFAPLVYGTAALIVVGTGGYRGYEYWVDTQSKAAGQAFLEAVQLSDEGKHEEAIAAFEALKDDIGGYPMLADLRIASELAASGKSAEAVELFDSVATRSGVSELYRGLASIRAAYVLLDTGSLEDVKMRANSLAQAGNAWRFPALEVIGAAEYKAGNMDAAKARFEEIVNDAAASGDYAGRARVYLDLIKAANG
ncbi:MULTISPECIES: tetratricopeptide repeat protein [Pseudovibrio]|uniref:tetratricopeptide repeat protein n=1 Tax=Stappiaceae TaxID=2821832 RepID=UPI0023666428|nr:MULTISPECIES: tetratricopeptide repeat protein [Pseudovibrio]MDD7908927.1 tetratricopeptide repeat protein [Pseudovibrio exalbescens]MDX5593752.1 tetratricopeptide repeat protein [Pseudovibrio sp. SPO723]